MKSITNDSLQGFEIFINKPNGVEAVWLAPKETIVVEDYCVSEQCKTLHKRLLVKIKQA